MDTMNTKKLRFLLVDDDTIVQNTYHTRFMNAGFELDELSNADGDFVKRVSELNPDVILMDIKFEGYKNNGVVAAEALLQDERTKNIPIIFLTNADDPELNERAKKMSSSIGFLTKTVHIPSEILSKVQELYGEFLKQKKF